MDKTIKIKDGYHIKVVSAGNLEASVSEGDAEMDIRVKEAVKAAINRAQICKKPIARYDKINQRAYIETADGEKKYV